MAQVVNLACRTGVRGANIRNALPLAQAAWGMLRVSGCQNPDDVNGATVVRTLTWIVLLGRLQSS